MSAYAASTLPRPTPLQRWAVLVFVSLAMFGNYYAYDALGPVIDLLHSQLGFSNQQTGLLVSIYNVGAIIALIVGGYIIDRFGTKRAFFAFAVVCLLAAALTAVSASYHTMVAGRFLLGIGAEPLIVAATTVLAKWFKGKELSFAFGINLSLSRLGSASADWSTGFAAPLYANWQDPLWLATAIAGISVAGAMLYWMMEKRVEGRVDLGPPPETEKLDLPNFFAFGRSFWYVVALCVVFYAVVFPFRTFAINYFQQAHGMAREAAGLLSSLLPLAAIIATPLFGLWVDRVGRRSLFMAVGALLILPLFLAITYLPPGPAVNLDIPLVGAASVPLTLLLVMLLMGVVFSLIPAVMWPSVAYIVDQRRLGSAYALMTLCQQAGWFVVPLAIGFLNDRYAAGPENPAGYVPGMWFYTVLCAIGVLFAWLLWRHENGPHGHGLDRITTRSPAPAEAAHH
jgi:MFS family permease